MFPTKIGEISEKGFLFVLKLADKLNLGLEWWNIGMMEWWNVGMVELWNIGMVEWWNDGIVDSLSAQIVISFSDSTREII